MAEKEANPQYAAIEQPFGCEPPVVHCPICGQAVVDREAGGVKPCPHLAFLYVSEISDYEFASDDFKKRTAALGDEEVELGTFPDFLKKAGYGNALLALEITYGGMACAPVWYTDVYGFDYGSLREARDS